MGILGCARMRNPHVVVLQDARGTDARLCTGRNGGTVPAT